MTYTLWKANVTYFYWCKVKGILVNLLKWKSAKQIFQDWLQLNIVP